MHSRPNLPLVFYQKLGEIFYAVAAADNVVRQEEYNALKEMVIQEWRESDLNESSNKLCQMEIMFNWFDYEQLDANSCFEHFEEYYKENSHLFTPEIKKLIWKTANTIADSVSTKNKRELIMLAKLQILL